MIDKEAIFYAKFIKGLRKKEGLSLKKIGDLFGVSGQMILNIENGKRQKHNEKLITSISNYTGIEESKIYNEIYYGKSVHKMSPFNHNEFFRDMFEEYNKNNNAKINEDSISLFDNNINLFYEYVYSLKEEWVMRYDTVQLDYMVRAIHYFNRYNIVYIITWNFAQIKYDFIIKERKTTLEIENIFLHAMFEIMKSEKDKPRTFTILFDAREETQKSVYNYLSSLEFKAPKFFIQFVLYDIESNTREDKIYK